MALVAIVGRPNVGKSTLFNRLTEERKAIVDDQPGVTRDRLFGEVEWGGRTFDLVDTGGLVPRSAERFDAAIREQVMLTVEEADVILFVVDTLTGISDLDAEVAAMLRRAEQPVFVVANKADNTTRALDAAEFWSLGFEHMYPLSAVNGTGTGDFLDAVVAALPDEPEIDEEDTAPRIAFLGRPNVGKSSLANKLLGRTRSIVTEVAGTTRDRLMAAYEETGALPRLSPLASDGDLALFALGRDAGGLQAAAGSSDLAGLLGAHLARIRPGDYFALTAYLEMNDANHELLQTIRHMVRDTKRVATTLGYGPRFLHSTGQLHKGGKPNGAFLQLVQPEADAIPIPGQPFGFDVLVSAQSLGDMDSLYDVSARAIRASVEVVRGWDEDCDSEYADINTYF